MENEAKVCQSMARDLQNELHAEASKYHRDVIGYLNFEFYAEIVKTVKDSKGDITVITRDGRHYKDTHHRFFAIGYEAEDPRAITGNKKISMQTYKDDKGKTVETTLSSRSVFLYRVLFLWRGCWSCNNATKQPRRLYSCFSGRR